MLNPDKTTIEWAAQWIEDSLKAETNERTIEFGKNMAMTFRAVALPSASLTHPAVVDDREEWFMTPTKLAAIRAAKRAVKPAGDSNGLRAARVALEKIRDGKHDDQCRWIRLTKTKLTDCDCHVAIASTALGALEGEGE